MVSRSAAPVSLGDLVEMQVLATPFTSWVRNSGGEAHNAEIENQCANVSNLTNDWKQTSILSSHNIMGGEVDRQKRRALGLEEKVWKA